MRINNKITEYKVDMQIEDLKNLLTYVIKTNEKLFSALDDIMEIIDDKTNIYDSDCDDIVIIKNKAEENSKALDKIYKIVDGDYE